MSKPLPPYGPLDLAWNGRYSQVDLVSGVTRHPLNVSTPTSDPHSTSRTALKTSPDFPFRRETFTSAAVTGPKLALLDDPPVSLVVDEAVRGSTWIGFQEDELDDARSALQ